LSPGPHASHACRPDPGSTGSSSNGTTPLSASLTLRRYNAPAPIKEIDVTFPADLPEAAA